MHEIYDLDEFRRKKNEEELKRKEKEETDLKIMKRLEERETEITSANLTLKNITTADLFELINLLKELREEKGVEFEVENFKTHSDNPIIMQRENSQAGFAPIQIILSILAGTIVLGGIVGGVLYFTKPDIKKPDIQQQSQQNQQSTIGDQTQQQSSQQPTAGELIISNQPQNVLSSGPQRLTDFSASLSFTNAHNLVINGNKIYLIFAGNSGGKSGIYLKKSTNLGSSWQKESMVSSGSGLFLNPSLAASGGVLHVVWQDTNGLIYYSHSADDGVSWSNSYKIYSSSQKTSSLPDVAIDNNYVYVAWMNANTRYTVLRVSDDGGKTWGAEINTSNCLGKDAERPNLLVDKNNILHQVWYDWCEGTASVRTSGIYHAVSRDHGATWEIAAKLVEAGTLAGHPYLIQDANGRFHLVYIKGSSFSVDSKGVPNVLRAYYRNSVDGISWSEAVELNSDTPNASARHPQIAYSEKYGLMAVWGDDNTKSYYSKTSIDGGKIWRNKLTITTNKNIYASAKIATDKNGNFHVVWEDDRNGKREIYYAIGDGKVSMFTVGVGSSGTSVGGTPTASLFALEGKSKPSQEKYGSVNTTTYTEKDPFVSGDGLHLYFFSNRGENKLLSLYTSARGSMTANWGAPQAIVFQDASGNTIDISLSDEAGPYIARIADKEALFFSADRLSTQTKSYGSYDLYVAEKISDTVFAQPKNLGSLVNTADDELGGSVYYDADKNKGVIFYAVGWKSNLAHNATYPRYTSYLGSKDENIWFNTFKISGGEYVFDVAKFFKYNKAGLIEDNPNLSADGKVLSYSAGTDPTQKNTTAKYGSLEYYGDFDIFYTYLEDNVWLTPRNFGGSSLNTAGHEANINILFLNGQAYLFYTYAPTIPYQFDFLEYFLGDYRAPSSSGDIFDNLPEMTESEVASGSSASSETNGSFGANCDLNKDGKVDSTEQKRCGSSANDSSQSTSGTPSGLNKCGDGVCETVEKTLCPTDCK